MSSVEIVCTACGADTLVKREPVYDGFVKTGTKLTCASCGHEFNNEQDVPFKTRKEPTIFTADDLPAKIDVFAGDEKGRNCRHCTHYTVNPFTQRCALHNTEVEATSICDDFHAPDEAGADRTDETTETDSETSVIFQPSGRRVFVLPGTILLEAAARAGFIIETPCGGSGKCGKCLVRIASGECPASDEEMTSLGQDRVEQGYRLACRCRATSNLVVEIPDSSLFQSGQKILSHDAGGDVDIRPAITKRFLRLDPPDRDDSLSDTERMKSQLGPVDIDITVLRSMPHNLRATDFNVTATITDTNRVVDVEPGDTTATCNGMAFDIGTTTLVGTLVDLVTGADLAVASMINPQTSAGDDVISRIRKCREEEDGLASLNKSIVEAVNSIVNEAAGKAGIETASICEAVFAGNTTMQEILCGINPCALGELPFVCAFREPLRVRAADLGLNINPAADVHVFPQIGGFVGGDTAAGIVATRLDRLDEPALFVDVGTNGELVLAHNGKLIATSVAAGPAFEGARIINGMRATNGAIEKVVIDSDVRINVIGNAKAAGICGTGLIDAVADMLRTGVLDSTGRILGGDELPDTLPGPVRDRVVQQDDWNNFMLVDSDHSATGEPLFVYQKDIRELQLANGAIRAGTSILLKMEGIDVSDLGVVMLAGAFGNFIRRSNARRIGMLPPVKNDRIRFVGNTASFGAKRALLSTSEREYAARVVDETRHVDLSLDPEFQMEFSCAMLFPDADIESS